MVRHESSIEIQGTEYGTARMMIAHTDLTDTAAAQTLLFSVLRLAHKKGALVPVNAVIIDAEMVLLEEFAGGSAATAVLTMGDAGVPAELLTAIDVFTGAGVGAVVKKNGAYTLGTFEATAYAAQVTITITADTVDNLTAGQAELRIVYRASSTTSNAS